MSNAENIHFESVSFNQETPLLAPFWDGYSIGVLAKVVNNLEIGNSNIYNLQQATFSNLTHGIDLQDASCLIDGNVFENNDFAILSHTVPEINGIVNYDYMLNNKLTIVQNTFTSNLYGVSARGWPFDQYRLELKVEGNHFTDNTHYSLRAAELATGTEVLKNNIQGSSYGIALWSFMPLEADILIDGNQISDVGRYGIWTQSLVGSNSQKCVISDNHIVFNTASSATRIGMNIEQLDKGVIRQNTVSRNLNVPYASGELEVLSGIWVENSYGAELVKNTLTGLGNGIYGIGALPLTKFYCNKLHYNQHGFHFDQNAQTIITDQGTPTMASDNEWVEVETMDPYRIFGLSQLTTMPNWYYRPGAIYDAYDGAFSTPYITYNLTPLAASSPCDYLKALPASEELLGMETIAQDDYSYPELEPEYKHKDKKAVYSRLRQEPSLYLNNTILENFVALMEGDPLNEILNVSERMSEGDFTEAILENQAIISDKLYVQNRKTVNAIYLNALEAGGLLSPADSASLLNIALTTPYLGGDAVYSARALLSLDVLDYGIEYRKASSDTEATSLVKKQEKAKIYPNPAKETLIVDLLVDIEEQALLSIYDLRGIQLYKTELEGISNYINIANLEQGIYFIELKLEGQTIIKRIIKE